VCEVGYAARGADVVSVWFCSVEMIGVICVKALIPIGDICRRFALNSCHILGFRVCDAHPMRNTYT